MHRLIPSITVTGKEMGRNTDGEDKRQEGRRVRKSGRKRAERKRKLGWRYTGGDEDRKGC